MEFVNRVEEIEALRPVVRGPPPALVRVYGRRRLGKTELLRKLLAGESGYAENKGQFSLQCLVRDLPTPSRHARFPILRERSC